MTLFKQFASSAFVLVSSDVLEDVRRVRARLELFPQQCHTLELLIINEKGQRRKLATTSLLWLVRSFKFVSTSIRNNLKNEDEELYISFTRAWNEEYNIYFNWIVKQIFSTLIRAVPDRQQFYFALGSNKEDVVKDCVEWLNALDNLIERLEKVLPDK